MSDAVDLSAKLATFHDLFAPRTVAEYNGHDVMVTKLRGPFIWHSHLDTDDFFLVLKGTLDIEPPRPHGDAWPRAALHRSEGGGAPSGGAR